MKKSTILGVLTAAALITTSAATYAAWDNTTATSESEFKLRESVKLTSDSTTFTGGQELSTDESGLTYTGDVTFKATTADLVDTLTLTPSVTKADDSVLTPGSYSINIEQTDDATFAKVGEDFVDKNISESNTYKVTLTITDPTLAGQNIKVSVDGTLTKAATPAS